MADSIYSGRVDETLSNARKWRDKIDFSDVPEEMHQRKEKKFEKEIKNILKNYCNAYGNMYLVAWVGGVRNSFTDQRGKNHYAGGSVYLDDGFASFAEHVKPSEGFILLQESVDKGATPEERLDNFYDMMIEDYKKGREAEVQMEREYAAWVMKEGSDYKKNDFIINRLWLTRNPKAQMMPAKEYYSIESEVKYGNFPDPLKEARLPEKNISDFDHSVQRRRLKYAAFLATALTLGVVFGTCGKKALQEKETTSVVKPIAPRPN